MKTMITRRRLHKEEVCRLHSILKTHHDAYECSEERKHHLHNPFSSSLYLSLSLFLFVFFCVSECRSRAGQEEKEKRRAREKVSSMERYAQSVDEESSMKTCTPYSPIHITTSSKHSLGSYSPLIVGPARQLWIDDESVYVYV